MAGAKGSVASGGGEGEGRDARTATIARGGGGGRGRGGGDGSSHELSNGLVGSTGLRAGVLAGSFGRHSTPSLSITHLPPA